MWNVFNLLKKVAPEASKTQEYVKIMRTEIKDLENKLGGIDSAVNVER